MIVQSPAEQWNQNHGQSSHHPQISHHHHSSETSTFKCQCLSYLSNIIYIIIVNYLYHIHIYICMYIIPWAVQFWQLICTRPQSTLLKGNNPRSSEAPNNCSCENIPQRYRKFYHPSQPPSLSFARSQNNGWLACCIWSPVLSSAKKKISSSVMDTNIMVMGSNVVPFGYLTYL